MNSSFLDFIIQIKNASLARRKKVELPFSKLNMAIGKTMVKEGFLESVDIKEEEKNNKKKIIGFIKYKNRIPVFTGVSIISKPSLHIFTKVDALDKIRNELGVSIISTSKGVMTLEEARKKGIGGEILFRIF